MILMELIDKRIYVILKNKYEYNGVVKVVDDMGGGLIFISMIDKNGRVVMFSASEIELLEVKE